MSDKQRTLDWHRRAYREFRSLMRDIDEERFSEERIEGRWAVREIVAHLVGWHRVLGAGLERMARGERLTPEGVDWSDTEGWNDIFALEAREKSKAEIIRELDESVALFRRLGEQLPEDRFGPGKTASLVFERAGSVHFQTHSATIWTRLMRKAA